MYIEALPMLRCVRLMTRMSTNMYLMSQLLATCIYGCYRNDTMLRDQQRGYIIIY